MQKELDYFNLEVVLATAAILLSTKLMLYGKHMKGKLHGNI
jgi:hypothetical protein